MSDSLPTVILVFGGNSSEHQVSCLTAGSVARALDLTRFRVVGMGITRSGRWVRVPVEEIREFSSDGTSLPELTEDRAEAVLYRDGDSGAVLAVRDGDRMVDPQPVDVAFSLIHGPFGEDGTIQGLFEMLGVRYVGSGVAASAIGLDKHLMKLVFSAQGIPIGPFVAITPREWEADRASCLDAVAALTLPVYVKPARSGSSLGITRVTETKDIEAAIEAAREHDPKVVVEEGFADVREVECAVLGVTGDTPEASAPGEIRMHTEDGFYDFDAKYLPDGQVTLDVPADLPSEVAEEVRALAVKTFCSIEAEGLARVDFFVGRTGRIWVNEINTMPGFTALSMFPMLWQHGGLDYPALVDRLLRLALERPVGLR